MLTDEQVAENERRMAEEDSIRRQLANSVEGANSSSLPIFIIADTFNRVVFFSHGYTIGLGEQLMNVAHRL